MPFHRLPILVSILVVLALPGCDPGLHYRPQDWLSATAFSWRTAVLPGVEVETSGIGGLIGSTALSPDFTVYNSSAEPVVFSRVVLDTKQGRYVSQPIRDGHAQWFTVPPRHTKHITHHFSLGQPLFTVLADPVVITLTFTNGTTVHSVVVPMVRKEQPTGRSHAAA